MTSLSFSTRYTEVSTSASSTRHYAGRVKTDPAKSAAQTTPRSRPVQFLARLGYAVNGLLHALIGIIAISVAIGAGGGEADQSGALSALASTPGGVFILWTVFIGLAALGLWLILSAVLFAPSDKKKRLTHGVSEIAKGAAYLALAATTFSFAQGGSASSSSTSQNFSASLLAAPGGPLLVGLLGVGIIGIGVYFGVKGITRRFTRDLTVPLGTAGRVTIAVGVFGYIAKGIVLVMVGILFCVAAATVDPSKSSGLDGGLKTLATLPFGVFILIIVGAGLIAYAIYSFVRARYAHL